jgi:ATP-dependent DNA helicase PIF1
MCPSIIGGASKPKPNQNAYILCSLLSVLSVLFNRHSNIVAMNQRNNANPFLPLKSKPCSNNPTRNPNANPFSDFRRLQQAISKGGGKTCTLTKNTLNTIANPQKRAATNQEYKDQCMKKSRNLPMSFEGVCKSSYENLEGREGLSVEQEKIAKLVLLGGQSVFFTGSAGHILDSKASFLVLKLITCVGTGKSYLLRFLIQGLEQKFGTEGVSVTAPTGVAAYNIKGTTLHSFAGIGIGDANVSGLANVIRYKNKQALNRWLETKVFFGFSSMTPN